MDECTDPPDARIKKLLSTAVRIEQQNVRAGFRLAGFSMTAGPTGDTGSTGGRNCGRTV